MVAFYTALCGVAVFAIATVIISRILEKREKHKKCADN